MCICVCARTDRLWTQAKISKIQNFWLWIWNPAKQPYWTCIGMNEFSKISCVPVMMHIVCAGIFDAQHGHKYHWNSVNGSLKKIIIVRAIKQKRSTLTDNSMWSMTAKQTPNMHCILPSWLSRHHKTGRSIAMIWENTKNSRCTVYFCNDRSAKCL